MASSRIMRTLARWHIWIGWLVGAPLLMWTLSGLVMVARPIEEVRGNHLRREAQAPKGLPQGVRLEAPFLAPGQPGVRTFRVAVDHGMAVATVTYADDSVARFDAVTGSRLPAPDEATIRRIVAEGIVGGERIVTTRRFAAAQAPLDWRRPEPVWQVALADGTHVYVDPDTGEIEAVRTRWWRAFDFMWGLHIMDLQEREDTHHPILIVFTALALAGVMLGCILMFRRRKRRVNS